MIYCRWLDAGETALVRWTTMWARIGFALHHDCKFTATAKGRLGRIP